MCRYLFGFFMVVLLCISCKEDVKKPSLEVGNPEFKDESFKKVLDDGDFNYQLQYEPKRDTSYLEVLYKGQRIDEKGFKGKITDEFVADANLDKKNEIYVVVEHKNKSQLFGYLVEGKKIFNIQKAEFRQKATYKSTKYKTERGQIVEVYSTKIDEGGWQNKSLRYNLLQRNNEYVLLPEGWHSNALSEMEGQYAARRDMKAGYYKVMFLKNEGGGNWNVDIKTKRNGDKKVLCSFNGSGYFVDRDLFVPLNQVNPNLKGVLKIRFVDWMAIVFTEDIEDSQELVQFCEDSGSIAGNFKKTDI